MEPRRRLAFLTVTAIALSSPLTITSAASATSGPAITAATSSSLGSIACPRADLCLAVGSRFSSPERFRGLAELWNGQHWRAIPTPSVPGAKSISLNAVTCLSARYCLVVGSFAKQAKLGAVPHGLVAAWNGSRWQVLPVAIPVGDGLGGVSCAGGVCMITGDKAGQKPAQATPVALQLRGNRIRVLKPVFPRGKTLAVFDDVSCTRPSSCLAVGSEGPGPSGSGPLGSSSGDLAETCNGVRWRLARIPQPKAATALFGVSCPDSTECLTVGWPVAGLGKPETLTLLDRNGHWHRLIPTGGKPSGNFATPPLSAVSCASQSSCVAVGSGGGQGSEVWNGTKLRFVTTPAENGEFGGISCVSPKRCVAVGSDSPNRKTSAAMAALWNGKSWKPLPIKA